jgi:putative DNA primase/helicase
VKQAYGQIDKERMEEGKALLRHAKDSGKLERRRAMIDSAAYEKGILSNLSEWDSDGWLLNVQNGVIDLRTQTFRERTKADMCMRQSPVIYDPKARCPLWESAMWKWMCGDRELVNYLQAALGVTLTSDTSLQSFFFLEGGGENGKDTFLSTIQKSVLGDDGGYCKGVNVMTLMETKWGHSEHRNDLAALAGATRMVTAAETMDGHYWDEATIKDMTGGMTSITCREIHGKPFSFLPQFKLWVMSNYAPVIKGTDWAIWRRVKRIPWNYDFSLHPEEKDPDFPAKLRAEAPGILNWMLAGLRHYLENGKKLPECKSVVNATSQYRMDMDIIGRFVKESLEFKPTATAFQKKIYSAYKRWCEQNDELPVKARRFFTDFRKRFPNLKQHGSGGTTQFVGVEVRFDPDPPGLEILD